MKYKFEDLEVYKLALDFVEICYELSIKYPIEEKFNLSNQLKRSATSIVLNIVEGSGKRTRKDFASYVRTAIGSLLESISNTKIGLKLMYISEKDILKFDEQAKGLYFKLIGLDKYLTNEKQNK